jgi:hypothetical protein
MAVSKGASDGSWIGAGSICRHRRPARLMPDFTTIADFQKNNGEAIRKFVVSSWSCAVALNCSAKRALRLTAASSRWSTRDRNFAQAKMRRRLAQIDESIARYLSQLDNADRQGEAVPEVCGAA